MNIDFKKIDKMTMFWLFGIIPETMMLCGILYQQYIYAIPGFIIAFVLSHKQANLAIDRKYKLSKTFHDAWIMLFGTFMCTVIIFAIFGLPKLLTA